MIDGFSSVRVLAVDDELFQLKLLTRQLHKAGLTEVQTFLEPSAALAQLQSDPMSVDIICCDLQMPDMDGVEFVRHLGQIGYRGGLVLISGEDQGILQAVQRLAAAHGLLLCGAFHKPVDSEQLRQAIAKASSASSGHLAKSAPQIAHELNAEQLAHAIESNQICVHYQPKVDLLTGSLIGVEALVRWQHPDHGLIFPSNFIELAEEFGLIEHLTDVMMFGPHGAVQQVRLWNDGGLRLQVAMNVSVESLKQHEFADLVSRKAAELGVDPAQLIIEVTESRVMRDVKVALDILTRLRLKRVGVSIDDFGTGHASLSKLHEIPFDELKIDRSFVRGAYRDTSLSAILLPTLDMARRLGIKTVAEGIEDAEDWHFLRSHGATLAQGYFIGKPMPPEDMLDWAANWEARRVGLVLQQSP